MDLELFNLCKSLYDKTGWILRDSVGFSLNGIGYASDFKHLIDDLPIGIVCPLYSSDSILQKLQKLNKTNNEIGVQEYHHKWVPRYGNFRLDLISDTPLISLLKLAIDLYQ